jgi:hypothetical protein
MNEYIIPVFAYLWMDTNKSNQGGCYDRIGL